MEITRGDIFIADLNPVQGSEQGGVRPVLVIQNDRGNRFSPTVICAAMTSRVGKSDLPTHAWVSARDSGLTHACVGRSGRWKSAACAPRPVELTAWRWRGWTRRCCARWASDDGERDKMSMRGGK